MSTIIGMIKKIASKQNIDVKPELVTVTTDDEAVRYRHIGGPTVQVEGLDIEPDARDIKTFGLA